MDSTALGFILVVAAAACTCLGALLAFIVRTHDTKFLATALGLSAGVMIYISLAEVYAVDCVESFVSAGYSISASHQIATLTFFGGIVLTWLLEVLVDGTISLSDKLAQRRAQRCADSSDAQRCCHKQLSDVDAAACSHAAVSDPPALESGAGRPTCAVLLNRGSCDDAASADELCSSSRCSSSATTPLDAGSMAGSDLAARDVELGGDRLTLGLPHTASSCECGRGAADCCSVPIVAVIIATHADGAPEKTAAAAAAAGVGHPQVCRCGSYRHHCSHTMPHTCACADHSSATATAEPALQQRPAAASVVTISAVVKEAVDNDEHTTTEQLRLLGTPSGSSSAPRPAATPMAASDHNDNLALRRLSLLSAIAVGIHNMPEGLATFVGTMAGARAGVSIALAIALHNIPEGIVIAMPILYASGSRWRALLWAALPGAAEILGGLVGYVLVLSNVRDPPLMYGIVFGLVAGMMVFISVQELLPTALRYDPANKYSGKALLAGMAIMAGSMLLFRATY